jgi:hypothetical protein
LPIKIARSQLQMICHKNRQKLLRVLDKASL